MRFRLLIILAVLACPLAAQDLLVSSRFASQVLRYDAQTGASKGVFAGGSGMANPNGIAIGPDRNLYVGLGDSGVVLRYDGQSGAFIDRFVSNEPGGFTGCRAIKFGPDGNLYVAAGPNDRILRYSGSTGQFIDIAAALPAGTGPVGLAIAADGTLYIGGGLDGRLHVFKDGAQIRQCTVGSAATGVAIGSDGQVYVATGITRNVIRFKADTCSGPVTFASGIALPIYMTFDRDGNLLVGAFNDNSVVRIDPAGKNLGAFVKSGSGGLSGTHDFAFVPEPVSPPETAPRLVLPGVGRVPGAGSFFRSTMWMTNPSDSEASVKLRFEPGSGFDRAGATDSDLITIPAHGAVTFADVIGDVFHATGNTVGVVIIETTESSPLPLVTARTFNDTPNGTFGQFIQALPIAATETGETWIHGLAADSSSRTNIGLVNFGSSAVAAEATCRSRFRRTLRFK
jgi:streptogramin lyase